MMMGMGVVFGQGGTLKGKVIDKETKEPLPFAYVYLEKDSKRYGVSQSDGDGIYEIKNIPDGIYDVKSTYTGYHPIAIKNVKIYNNKITYLNLNMNNYIKEMEMYKDEVKDTIPLNKNDLHCKYFIRDTRFNSGKYYFIDIYDRDSLELNKIYNLPSPYFEILLKYEFAGDPLEACACSDFRHVCKKGKVIFHDIKDNNINMSLQLYDYNKNSWNQHIDLDEAYINFSNNKISIPYENIGTKTSDILNQYKEVIIENEVIKSKSYWDDKYVYLKTEQMPEFPGGKKKMKRFIKKGERELTKKSKLKRIAHELCMEFVVNEDGTVGYIHSINTCYGSCQMKEILETMPKWQPGMNVGKVVPFLINLNVKYKY